MHDIAEQFVIVVRAAGEGGCDELHGVPVCVHGWGTRCVPVCGCDFKGDRKTFYTGKEWTRQPPKAIERLLSSTVPPHRQKRPQQHNT